MIPAVTPMERLCPVPTTPTQSNGGAVRGGAASASNGAASASNDPTSAPPPSIEDGASASGARPSASRVPSRPSDGEPTSAPASPSSRDSGASSPAASSALPVSSTPPSRPAVPGEGSLAHADAAIWKKNNHLADLNERATRGGTVRLVTRSRDASRSFVFSRAAQEVPKRGPLE